MGKKNSIIAALVFTAASNIQIAHAAFLNMGTTELVMLLVVGFLFLGFLVLIFFLAYSLIKRIKSKMIPAVPNSVEINISQPIYQQEIPVQPKQDINQFVANAKITLPMQYETRFVLPEEIVRCEADDNYTNFIFSDGEKILISKPLKEYADLLKPRGFVRAHQSHLVNPKFVKSWLKEDGGLLLMNNGDKIPVSKPNREMVKNVLGK